MLAEGMVTDEAKRLTYYQTLHAEADRLDHLVQNVLAYARLEKSSRDVEYARTSLGELLGRIQNRLAERVRQQDMQLLVSADTEILDTSVEAAAETAPGVGLGLALSLRLARKMGGDLALQPTREDGACFVLTLPI